MKSEWKFDWLTSWDEIWHSSFLNQWENWLASSAGAHVFFTPELVRAWVETCQHFRSVEPRFLVARREGETVFFPLVYERRGWKDAWQNVIVPAGHPDFDYQDPVTIWRNGPAADFWPQMVRETQRLWGKSCDVFLMKGLREISLAGTNGCCTEEIAPWIDLSGIRSFDAFMNLLGKKLRQDIRYQIRRLEKEGTLVLRRFQPHETVAAQESLGEFLRVRRERWPDADIFPDLFNAIIARALPSDLLHYSELQYNGIPVSWVFGFVYRRRFYYYVPTFRQEMTRYSPGKIHIAMLVEEAIQSGLEVFDLLRGDEPYKRQWTDKGCTLYSLSRRQQGLKPALTNAWQEMLRPRIVSAKKKFARR